MKNALLYVLLLTWLVSTGGNFGSDLDQNAGAEREIGTGSDSDDDTPVVLAKLLQARILSPPEGHVFEDEGDVQMSAAVAWINSNDYSLPPGIQICVAINWGGPSCTPLDPSKGDIVDVAIPNLYEGPHLVEIHALDDQGRALPGVNASIKFFLRKESHEVNDEWLSSLLRVIIQHPPEGHRFLHDGTRGFPVQLRVVDKEMSLSFEEAAGLMMDRRSIDQKRPFSVKVKLAGVETTPLKKATSINLPVRDLASPGEEQLSVTLMDVHGTEVWRETRIVYVERATGDDRGTSRREALSCPSNRWNCPQATSTCACSGHGTCTQEIAPCRCEPDWYGIDCSHGIMASNRYLPFVEAGAGSSCWERRSFSDMSESLSRVIWKNQHGCPPAGSRPDFTLRVRLKGLGVMLQWLAAGVSEAIESNRTMRANDNDWPWLSDPALDCSGLSCYFQPLSSCLPAATGEELHAKKLVEEQIIRMGMDEGGDNANIGIFVPEQWQEKGQFWFRSHALWNVLKLNSVRETQLRDMRSNLGLGRSGGQVIGVHVRHGDACEASTGYRTPCQPVEAYMKEVRTMASMYGVKEVFIASDDPTALTKAAQDEDLLVSFVPLDRSMLQSDWFVEDRILGGHLDASEAGFSAIMDLFLLASCDFFVGTMSSHFGALALELMAARKGYLPPYISLDIPWSARH